MKLSIITINYNNLSGLKKTMESVFSQTCKDFEYIVIDGASTDGSAQLVKENADKIDYWVSEKDTGIYNAMNKGVKVAKGEYVLMLNSGDYLVNDNVVEKALLELDGTDIIQGNILEIQNDEINKSVRNRGYGKSNVDWFDVIGGNFLHQASFCKKTLFETYGSFDESYKIVGDTKFFMLCLGKGDARFRYVDIDVSCYDMSGISSDWNGKQGEVNRLMNELYSRRQREFYDNNAKKIRLYNQLHRHRWVWSIVMFISFVNNMIYDK